MAEVKHVREKTDSDQVVDKARDFWSKNGRIFLIISGAIILLGGGYLAYKYLVQAPKEQKAAETIWKAEDYFAQDSLAKALAGDGQYAGFEKVISQYGGTKTGELANFYAGATALKAGDNNKAVKYLEDFDTDAKQIQARAYKLLADAYANLNKNTDALSNYKKAARAFEDDRQTSSEYLFYAAYFADRVMNDKKQAIELYKELKEKYPTSQYGYEADKFLAQAGVYKTED